jgi:hypothetical protein
LADVINGPVGSDVDTPLALRKSDFHECCSRSQLLARRIVDRADVFAGLKVGDLSYRAA